MIKVAGIQMGCSEDKSKNVDKAINLAKMACEEGAKIICFQELFNTHWFPKEVEQNNFDLAEKVEGGETIPKMQELAKEGNAILICPIFEKDTEGVYYNTAVVINKNGEILGKYRKMHLPQIPLWQEKSYFKPGNLGFPVFKTDEAVIGIQICWDNFFPEGARILAIKGAQIIFSPTAAAFASQQKWQKVIMANAISNNVFIFRVNRVGSEERQDFYGESFCVNPNGELLVEPSGVNDGVVLVDVDLDLVKSIREEWAFLRDRREETYGEIAGFQWDDSRSKEIKV